ncbi:MAG: glycosyltransferase [Planctomycetes bacterium]|nr:glycosyltransferase [Planctomycetota bacterium]
MTKRALMVAFHFPPSGAVAAQRAHKFARYLPEFGWEPVVVARRPDPMQPRDESFAGNPAPAELLEPSERSRLLGLLPKGWIDPLRRFVCIPDEETGWRRLLRKRLPELIERHRPDLLWANSVPTGSLVAAADAARRSGIPLVVDFHNEWTRNMYYRPSTRWHDEVHRQMEREVIETARGVTTLNPMHTEDLRSRFPSARVETIENGCDPGDYEVEPARPARRPIVFTYAGAVYGYQSPEPFLQALAATGAKDVEVRVVGDRFSQFKTGAWPFKVTVEGHRTHRDLGAIFSPSSAFFLCLEPPAARQIPAKLYEYLCAGRPTFAIAPKGGAVDQWLARTGAGVCADSAAPASWGPALQAFMGSLEGYRAPSAEPFHRRALTERLARFFDEVLK